MDNLSKMANDDWDILVVLDACRADFFFRFFKEYFDGKLETISSLGSCTREWFVNTFKTHYEDIVYVSANPYINSAHTILNFGTATSPWLRINQTMRERFGLDAKKYFHKIVDVWRFGWNVNLGTVPPQEVTDAVLSLKDRYPRKRFIVHYMQPHAPYISGSFRSKGFPKPDLAKGKILEGIDDVNQDLMLLIRGLSFLLNRMNFQTSVGNLYLVNLLKFFRLPSASPMANTIRASGLDGLRKAYLENLKIALRSVAFMASFLSEKKIVVTSDHGEFLGENRRFGHPCKCQDPILRNVPWLEISQVKNVSEYKEILHYKVSKLKHRLKSRSF